jgi:hypothetical protein
LGVLNNPWREFVCQTLQKVQQVSECLPPSLSDKDALTRQLRREVWRGLTNAHTSQDPTAPGPFLRQAEKDRLGTITGLALAQSHALPAAIHLLAKECLYPLVPYVESSAGIPADPPSAGSKFSKPL